MPSFSASRARHAGEGACSARGARHFVGFLYVTSGEDQGDGERENKSTAPGATGRGRQPGHRRGVQVFAWHRARPLALLHVCIMFSEWTPLACARTPPPFLIVSATADGPTHIAAHQVDGLRTRAGCWAHGDYTELRVILSCSQPGPASAFSRLFRVGS